MKRISVFGLGYVGCVSAACLAEAGFELIGIDLNEEKVDMINNGKSPIVEPGLDELLAKVVSEGKLRATTSCEEAVINSDLAFICVGTPGDENGKLRLNALQNVSREIGQVLKGSTKPYTVVVRSTVLPGTTQRIVTSSLLATAGEIFRPFLKVAMNPEFIREGTALKDFANPPFTLVGSEDGDTENVLKEIYKNVDAPYIHTSLKTAEAVKYLCNSYHALKVCFANEAGDICQSFGIDAQEVMRIFCMDTKLNISDAYLRPGFAFGGSCLPKDLRALLYATHHADVALPLFESILPSNEAQIEQAITKVLASGKKRIGILGLSFKPDTDDLRESPMVRLVETFIGKGFDVRIFDRNVSIAKLTGANRRYIVEEIPHIASLMCDDHQQILAHSELLVISNNTKDVEEILAQVGTDCMLVDLTRGTVSDQILSQEAA